jgi:hypothetical protein
VAIDIAPVDYHVRRHDEIFAAINAVTDAGPHASAGGQVMREHLNEEGVIQFLLKSFVDGQWRFNVPVLWEQYDNIVGWETVPAWPHPALFIPAATPLRHRRLPRRAAGPVPAGARARHRRRRALGACRKTGGRYPRHPPLSDLYRRVIG